MRGLARVLTIALAILAIAAGAAYADATIYAAPPNQFVGGDVTVAQGELVTFTNGDSMTHDVTASGKGSDGKPLFASAQIGIGQSAPVEGVEYLTTGSYPYICSIHPFMKGTITVSSEGTPKPRPGNGGSSTQPGSQPAGDSTAPSVSVKVLDTRRSKVRKRRSLQIALTTNEAAGTRIRALSGKVVLASGSARLQQAGSKKVSVKLTKAGLKAVKRGKPVRVTVTVTAADAAGNKSTAKATGRLR